MVRDRVERVCVPRQRTDAARTHGEEAWINEEGGIVMTEPGEQTMACQACGATFVNERALFRHTEEVHGGGSAGRNTDDVPGADIPDVQRGP